MLTPEQLTTGARDAFKGVNALPKITCAACGNGKLIDRVLSYFDDFDQCWHYALKCHGATETFKVEVELLTGHDDIRNVDYVAFKPALDVSR